MTPEDYAKLNALTKQYQDQQKSGADEGVLGSINDQISNIGKTSAPATPQATTGTAKTAGISGYTSTPSTNNYSDYINQLYAAKNSTALAGLQSAYNQNVSALNSTASKIPQQYTAERNQTAGTYETNRANLNERAAATGMNSGAGSQLAMSMANNYAGNLNTLNNSEATALSDVEAKKADLATQYNTAIAQAQSENDLAKAQALYEEGVRAQNELTSQQQYAQEQQTSAANTAYSKNNAMAETLAQYGDFSGYKALGYTDAQIAQMKAYWDSKQKKTTTYSGKNNNNNNNNNTPIVEFNAQPATQSGFGGATMADINDATAQVKAALASGETLQSLGAKIYAQKGTMDATTFGAYMAAIQLAAKNSK